MPRPVKQLAVLLLIRAFHFAMGFARMSKKILIAAGRMLVDLIVAVGGPLYRWSRRARLGFHTAIGALNARPTMTAAVLIGSIALVGIADNALHRSAPLDPLGNRILFQLLATDETRTGTQVAAFDIGDDGQSVATMTNGDTAVLKPQILTPLASRKTPSTYTVASGDSISSIADRFGLKATTLLWANKLTLHSTLQVGQTLSVLPVDGVQHTVKAGDTVAAIAKRYSTTEEKILSFNGIKAGTTLRLATNLIIPDGRPAYEAPPPAPPSAPRTRLAQIEGFISRSIIKPVQRLGNMFWPTTVRRLTQYFSWRHPGIDIGATLGSPVYAAGTGVVFDAGWNRGGYGNQVILEHPDGKRTRYAHLSKINVEIGEPVAQGDVIGLIGSTGRSTGPHLHFEVMSGGKRLNPLGLLR